MKTFIITFLSLILSICSKGQEIKPPTPIESDREWIVVEEHQISVRNGGLTKIRLLTVKDWTDPGDVLKIEVTDEKGTKSYSNIDGWVKFDNKLSRFKRIKRKEREAPQAKQPKQIPNIDV